MLEWIISSSVLIAVVIALRFALKGKISLRLQYALWALVLVRLIIPFSFGSSSFSVMNSVEQSTVYQTTSKVVTTVQVPSDIIRDSELTIEEAQQVGQGTLHRVEGYPVESGRENLHTYSFQDSLKEVGTRVLRIVWICGMVVTGLWFAGSNLILSDKLRKSRSGYSYENCTLPVYTSDAVDTPCLFGLFRPAVYLTSEAASDEATTRHAVEHELTHYVHKDHIWAILRGVCLAVHWYNPLVWWAAILSRNDAELACDEATIRRLGESERAAYGRTLIGLTCEKRSALLNTATTMTGSGKSIKERIALIAKKPKMAAYTLVAVILIAAIAVGCTFTGAKDPVDNSDKQTEDTGTVTPPTDEQTNLFADMEAYVRYQIEQKKTVSYYSATTQDQATVDVLDAKIAWLEKQGEVFGLAPDGTLEAWTYNILVKPDADTEDIMLVGGQYDEDGYYDLEGQGGRITVALRTADGKYDVLYDAVINDGLDFYGYCKTVEEAIHDWYVKKYDLDLPLYATEWIDYVTLPEGAELGNYPVHRFDGDGWYLYIPVQVWNCPKGAEVPCVFTSAYSSGSTLKIDYFDYAPDGLSDDHRKQGFTLIDEANQIWSHNSDGISTMYYCFDAQDGGCWRVTIEWIDANITEYPYIAMEPDVLKLMAQSFRVYGYSEKQSIDAFTRLTTLRAEDIKHTAGFCDVDVSELAALLSAVPANRIDYTGSVRAFWTLDVYLSGGPHNFNTGTDEWFSIRTGPEENIVEIIHHSEEGKYSTLYFEDEALYWFVRGTYMTEEIIDEDAFARFGEILSLRAQARVDGSKLNELYVKPYSGYEIIRFVKVDEFTQGGAKYEIYEWNVAFFHDNPISVLAGGMWVDSELRVRDLEQETYFVTRTSGDLVDYEFFFYDLYFGPDEDSGRDNAHATIVEVFSSAQNAQPYGTES